MLGMAVLKLLVIFALCLYGHVFANPILIENERDGSVVEDVGQPAALVIEGEEGVFEDSSDPVEIAEDSEIHAASAIEVELPLVKAKEHPIMEADEENSLIGGEGEVDVYNKH